MGAIADAGIRVFTIETTLNNTFPEPFGFEQARGVVGEGAGHLPGGEKLNDLGPSQAKHRIDAHPPRSTG